ncbi:hypothetical protein HK405_012643, partial [Cladochytrium tenue]
GKSVYLDEQHGPTAKLRSAVAERDPTYSGPALGHMSQHDFGAADTHAMSPAVAAHAHDLQQLAGFLTGRFAGDALQQYRALFSWIAHNVSYDVDAFLHRKPQPPQTAAEVLRRRSAVCVGYADLFRQLCTAASLPCETLRGAARGAGSAPADTVADLEAHAWNAVLVRGEHRFVDCTWGAGTVNGTQFSFAFTPHWFMVRPQTFALTHVPAETDVRAAAAAQHLDPPLTHQDWLALPFATPVFAALRTRIVSLSGAGGAAGMLSYAELTADQPLALVLEFPDELQVAAGAPPAGAAPSPDAWRLFADVYAALPARAAAVTAKATAVLAGAPHRDQLDRGAVKPRKPAVRWSRAGARPGHTRWIFETELPPGNAIFEINVQKEKEIKPGVVFPVHRLLGVRVLVHPPQPGSRASQAAAASTDGPGPTLYASHLSLLAPTASRRLPQGSRQTFRVQLPPPARGGAVTAAAKAPAFVLLPDSSRVLLSPPSDGAAAADGLLEARDVLLDRGRGPVRLAWETGPRSFSFVAEFECV